MVFFFWWLAFAVLVYQVAASIGRKLDGLDGSHVLEPSRSAGGRSSRFAAGSQRAPDAHMRSVGAAGERSEP